MRGEEECLRKRGRTHGDDDVAGLEACRPRHDRMRAIESPVRGLALRFPKGAMFLPPPWERWQTQPARDDAVDMLEQEDLDRKSTRLNSSHVEISYAVSCLKK